MALAENRRDVHPKYSRSADNQEPEVCPVCEGYGRWHSVNGEVCLLKVCNYNVTICLWCDGTGNDPRV